MKNIRITFEINRQQLICIAISLIAHSRPEDNLNLTRTLIRNELRADLTADGIDFDLLDIESHPILSRSDIDSIAEEAITTLFPEYNYEVKS